MLLLLERGHKDKGVSNGPSVPKEPSPLLLQPFPPQPGGLAAQVAAMNPMTVVGGRTEAQGETEVLGLHLNFPAH